MTIVEKAAYLKGLADGLGVLGDSKEGKLWNCLTDLLGDMARELEELQENNMDFAEALDEIGEELTYLEELTCDLDLPEDMCDDDCDGNCSCCGFDCDCGEDEDDDEDEDEDDDEDEDEDYDGLVYEVKCPVCGEEITVDEETLEEGSIHCPVCGELLEFELEEDEEE